MRAIRGVVLEYRVKDTGSYTSDVHVLVIGKHQVVVEPSAHDVLCRQFGMSVVGKDLVCFVYCDGALCSVMPADQWKGEPIPSGGLEAVVLGERVVDL